MGYTKKWTPPTIPLRDNLAAWKTLVQDLHDNLILAGLVQSATAGQLDISSVTTLPADGTYAGFIEYEFDDALQAAAPVVLRLEYGCGIEGLGASGGAGNCRSRTPRLRVTVIFCGSPVAQFGCPQSVDGTGTSNAQLTTYGASAICLSPEYGFLGVVYGAGSRNNPQSYSGGGYIGATLSLFVQRSLDDSGSPTADALYIYNNNYSYSVITANLWTSGITPLAVSTFAPNAATPVTRTDMAPRVGRLGHSAGVDEVLLEPIFVPSSPAKAFPFIVSYRNTDISVGSEFAHQPLVGPQVNFIALGRETCMAVDSVDGQNAGIAMLFE